MKSITVFCGSSMGTEEQYKTQASFLGEKLALKGITLIYGGAKIGLMGAVADGVLNKKGKVIGVLPRFLGGKEIAHDQLTEMILVDTMHQRKTRMNELCEGVIALPGGFGTLEELFEMITWAQLGLHKKPIGILNTDGYYDHLIALIQHMVDKGLLKESNKSLVLVSKEIDELLDQMENYVPPVLEQWISEEEL
jgi:uncharacterized protein (TIGR00730 family)